MSEEDSNLQKHLVDEMMKVSESNPDVMFYMETLMKKYEELEQKVEQLESIRKEAIEFIDWHYKDNKEFFKNKGIGLNYPECDALLNILNKGSNKE